MARQFEARNLRQRTEKPNVFGAVGFDRMRRKSYKAHEVQAQ
jgi:hypothetical protein